MNYIVGPGNPYGPNDDTAPVDEEKYVTVRNVLFAITFIVVVIAAFVIGIMIGAYMKGSEIKPFPEETTTEELCVTTTTTTTMTTTTTTETTTTEETTTSTTTITEMTTTSTKVVTTTTTKVVQTTNGLTSLGSFKGTYYAGKTVPCKGGSGRTLIDCSTGGNGVKGSVASKLVYQNYGYKRKGERTKVYLEIAEHPSMNGWYYVDDCNAVTSIIDFYFYYNRNCPFQKAGVISVKAYI